MELTYRMRPEAFARLDGTVEVLHHYHWDDGVVITEATKKQRVAGIVGVIQEVFNTTEYHEILVGETCPLH